MPSCSDCISRCCLRRAQSNLPKDVPLTGECVTLELDDYTELLKQACPLPPRDLFYYNKEGKLVRHFDFCMQDRDSGDFYTKAGGVVYKVILSEKGKKKHANRWDQIHCLDQYLRQFRIADSSETFLKLNAFMRTEIKYKNRCHKYFHNFICGGNEDFTKDQRKAMKLRPEWIPERMAFLGMLARCLLNCFYIVYQFWELRDIQENHGFVFFVLALFIMAVEGYMFVARLMVVLDDLWTLFKRIVITHDTLHFQTKNLALDLVKLSAVSVLRYLPSTETVSMAFKRRKEWIYEWRANVEFQMYAIPRRFPLLVFIREIVELALRGVMPFIAPFSLLTKVAALPWMVNRRLPTWSLTQFVIYAGFVNQLSGLRKIKRIEAGAIEHLIFSGADAKLQLEEHLMINSWWNYVLLSAVSNCSHKFEYPIFDQIVFWYILSPRKLQLIMKNHELEGGDIVELNKEGKLYQLQSKHGYLEKGRRVTKGDESELSSTAVVELVPVGVDGEELVVDNLQSLDVELDEAVGDAGTEETGPAQLLSDGGHFLAQQIISSVAKDENEEPKSKDD